MTKPTIHLDNDLRRNNLRQITSRAISTALLVAIITWMFYQTALEQQTARLMEIAQSRATLIRAMAAHAETHHSDEPHKTRDDTLEQLRRAQDNFPGMGETGEFALAQQVDNEIIFLLNRRHDNHTTPPPVQMEHGFAEPMRRALGGRVGSLQDLDYRGIPVLAAHWPIPELNWGIVAKIDLAEVRAPFIRVGVIAVLMAVLITSISAFLALRSMRPFIKALKQSEEQLHWLAHHDGLTDLPNRLLFEEYCHHAFMRAQRNQTKLALLYLDLDRFKPINDRLGHATGDQLLQRVASRLQDTVREMDTVARLGGDEFVILMEDLAHYEDAERVAKKLLAELDRPFNLNGQLIQTGGSVGISLYPEDSNDWEELLQYADAAMYQAKQAGPGNYAYYSAVKHAPLRPHIREPLTGSVRLDPAPGLLISSE